MTYQRSSEHPMLQRYARLQALKLQIDAEMLAVERGLIVAGILSRHGRPRAFPTHTASEARSAHAAWQRGERDDWVLQGERQYQREKKRDERARRRKVA